MAAQAEAGRGLRLTEARDWLLIVASVAIVVGALATGIQWVVSSAVVPLYAEMRGVNNRMDGMDSRLGRIEAQLDSHSGVFAELRERLVRIETILSEPPREGGG